ncbi:G-protein coupled receptor 4-like [Brachyhypopomus gauderio]|uniref:G-protein coupled receptor 4-like n=1 Tax=Brachyhypopomus gauderio TaxID=698409 RepID=UPI004042031B
MSNSSVLNATATGWRHLVWYQLDECAVAPYGFIFYFGVKVFNLFVGFPTNVLVMWQIARRTTEGTTSDVFIFNLAILDALFSLMTPIDLINSMYLNDAGVWYAQRFAFGLKDMAVLFLTCICLDRYVAVVHPILFTGIRDQRFRVGVSAAVWGLILAYALTKSILGRMQVNGVFSGVILSAFSIMVFCNVSIIWALRRSVAGKEVMNPMKKKALKMVVTVLAIITVNYLPPVALMPFASAYSLVDLRCKISISVFSIMDLSCTIEPLLHLSKMEKPACLQGPVKKPPTVSV